jgi:hypothetical protein
MLYGPSDMWSQVVRSYGVLMIADFAALFDDVTHKASAPLVVMGAGRGRRQESEPQRGNTLGGP